MNWNQSMCDPCWNKENPTRIACRVRMLGEEQRNEKCCMCGENTQSGIYVRRNPAEVPFPSE